MKLYYKQGSCSLSIRIAIHEMGIACDFEAVDLATKITETGADYWAINPKGSVPALQLDNGETITENSVIQQYLADTHKATHLLPAVGELARYRVLEWMNVVATDLHAKCFASLWNPNVPQEVKDTVYKGSLKRTLNLIEKQLSETTYLTGEYVSLADFYLFVIVRWALNFDIALTEWPFLSNYLATIQERKAVKRAFDEEGLTATFSGGACGV